MGNYNSGRRRTRNIGAVEQVPKLDVRWLRQMNFALPGQERAVDLSWTLGHRPDDIARCVVTHSLGPDGCGMADIRRSATVYHQRVEVVSAPMRYGGVRLFYVCPALGRRCEILYLVGGVFASRQAHRLTYRSQSIDEMGGLRRRSDTLKNRWLGTEGHPRPRGVRRARFADAYRRAEGEYWRAVGDKFDLLPPSPIQVSKRAP